MKKAVLRRPSFLEEDKSGYHPDDLPPGPRLGRVALREAYSSIYPASMEKLGRLVCGRGGLMSAPVSPTTPVPFHHRSPGGVWRMRAKHIPASWGTQTFFSGNLLNARVRCTRPAPRDVHTEFQAAGDAELAVDDGEMVSDGLFRDVE